MVYGNEARPEGPALGPRVPAPRYHIPYTILPFTIYNLPCTIYHLLFTIYCLPLTIYHLLFTIYYLPFTIYHLLFTIYYLPFTICHLLITIYYLPPTIYHLPISLLIKYVSGTSRLVQNPSNTQRNLLINRFLAVRRQGGWGVPLLTEGAGY